jgi:hypothetical protein
MLKLYRIDDDFYLLLSEMLERPFSGNRNAVAMKLQELGMETREMEEGLFQLRFRRHNIAHFGINLRFIFCEQILDAAQLPQIMHEIEV